MTDSVLLFVDLPADAARVFEAVSTAEGNRGFFTDDCEADGERLRFGFPGGTPDLDVEVSTEPNKLVRLRVVSGFPYWSGSTWEFELGEPSRGTTGTGLLFRHYGFGDGHPETELGGTAQTWARILDRLKSRLDSGEPQPLFTATT